MHSVLTGVPKYLRTHLLKTKGLDWSVWLNQCAGICLPCNAIPAVLLSEFPVWPHISLTFPDGESFSYGAMVP